MILEVYDADMLTKGDFLGQVILSSTQLLFPPSEKLTCALEPKPGMSEKQLKLIKGTITIQANILSSLEKERAIEMKPLPKDSIGGDVEEEMSRIEIALDLQAERERWDQDNLTLPSIVEHVEEMAMKARSSQSGDEEQMLISEIIKKT